MSRRAHNRLALAAVALGIIVLAAVAVAAIFGVDVLNEVGSVPW